MPADGNQIVKAPINAGGNVAAIVARSFDDAYRIANALAASGITPFKKAEECLAVIMAGAELGLTPFAATQSFAVINGRVSIWGDGMMAVVRSRGVRVAESLLGEGDKMVATCTVTRPDDPGAVTRTFNVADAKRAGLWDKQGPWKQYPQRMLAMRARAWAIRDACADMLRGLKMAEEMQDVEPEPLAARVIDRTDDQRQEDVRGEFVRGAAARAVAATLIARMEAAPDAASIDAERDEFLREYRGRISNNLIFGVEELALTHKERVIMERMSACRDLASLEEVASEVERMGATAPVHDHYEACAEALADGRAPPDPPRPPARIDLAASPFAALKAEGEAVTAPAALHIFTEKLTKNALGKCTADERTELKAIRDAAKKRSAKPNEGAGAPQPTPTDAASPASESAPSSLSVAEVKKLQKEILRMLGEAQTLKEVDSLPGMFADDLARAPADVREKADKRFAAARAKFEFQP